MYVFSLESFSVLENARGALELSNNYLEHLKRQARTVTFKLVNDPIPG